MTDINDFMGMAEEPLGVKRAGRRKSVKRKADKAIFACTVCKKIHAPTRERNLRCTGCHAPLLQSIESVSTIQKEIKRHSLFPDIVAELKAKLITIKTMKKEHAQILESHTIMAQVQFKATKAKVLKCIRDRALVFHITVPVGVTRQYPDGFKGDIEVPIERAADFEQKCKKLDLRYYLKATKREIEVMEDMRQLMIEQIDSDDQKRLRKVVKDNQYRKNQGYLKAPKTTVKERKK